MTTRKPARRAARPAAPADQDAVVPASPPSAAAKVTSPPRVPAATTRPPPQLKVVKEALADMKAVDARVLDVRGLTDISDYMVIASGTSDRHVRSIADNVVRMAKSAGVRPFGVEGAKDGEWVLVDLPDVMVHVMLPRVREFYGLEQLWEPPPAPKASAVVGGKPRRAAGARKPARAGSGAAAQGKASGAAARKAPRTAQGGPRRRPPRAG
jgi:ribosome silencing factor RsfS/YbeB/iojap